MKSRFTSADTVAAVADLQRLVGMRVIQVYDVDSKTYLFKLGRQEEKAVLLFESGIRIHTTEYEWPKGSAPSGFSMKMRKHLKNKRVESIRQVGIDRIVAIQFGINDAAYHVIIELYDRGNVVLTDENYVILNILRPRQAGSEDVRFAVREKYPIDAPTQNAVEEDDVRRWLEGANTGETLKKVILPRVFCGPSILDHCLRNHNKTVNAKINRETITDIEVKSIHEAILEGHEMLERFKQPGTCCGLITLKVEKRVQPAEDGSTEMISYDEFHPFHFKAFEKQRTEEFDSFLQAVDAFFSRQEEQRISMKSHNLEKQAVKKLENIKVDHESRVRALEAVQKTDVEKAKLIENNLELVEKALFAVRSAIASQIGWREIDNMIREARAQGDPIATSIKQLHLDRNHFSMALSDPFEKQAEAAPTVLDIDIDLSAYANATKYFDKKKQAAKKQLKTLESSAKALKSAQRKTREVLKQVELTTNIARARKTYWFEKFYWFISSENYLVIGGRDAPQNEMIVKKYLRKGDVYVHADLHGASSVVIKNPSGEPIPPKTLTEAGTMAISYSAAWEAKVVTTAWWVYHDQVSKNAPTGEYLSQGSFMVRGKKNFLPPLFLIMGFGFMFRLEEESIPRHAEDRKARLADDNSSVADDAASVADGDGDDQDQAEIAMSSSDDDDETGAAFPDTQVQVLQPIGGLVQDAHQPENEEVVVYSQPIKSKTVTNAANKKKDKGRQQQQQQQQQQQTPQPAADGEGQRSATGQKKKISKAKQRKIKQRYGDQDEEERQLKMKLLASAGKQHSGSSTANASNTTTRQIDSKDTAKARTDEEALDEGMGDLSVANGQQRQTAVTTQSMNEPEEVDEDAGGIGDEDEPDEADDDAPPTDDLTALLNSLTGVPVEEDTLLYAVPICAPYSTMTNYKYKVKLAPGTNKRGKAAKTALTMFQHDKSATQREKDLLRAAKDQEVARNMPGKVKMSAANLQKYKK